MIVHGVLIAPELCEHVGRAIVDYQERLHRDGVAVPALAVLQEEMLALARRRKNLAARDAARASSEVRSLPFRVLGTSEAAAISGWSVRTVQLFAASGVVGRKVNGRYVLTEAEVADLARRRRNGQVAGATDGRGGGDQSGGGAEGEVLPRGS